jgi:hypothetical protein
MWTSSLKKEPTMSQFLLFGQFGFSFMGVLEPLVLKIWKKIQKLELKLDPALEPQLEPPLARTKMNPKTYLTKVSILHILIF